MGMITLISDVIVDIIILFGQIIGLLLAFGVLCIVFEVIRGVIAGFTE